MKTAIQSAKLTKSFLMSAQEGLFLVSNVGHSHSRPLFAEIVQSAASNNPPAHAAADIKKMR